MTALAILNLLMSADDYISTKQIINELGCTRATVYNNIAMLESQGFMIDVIGSEGHGQGFPKSNLYKYIGLAGRSGRK